MMRLVLLLLGLWLSGVAATAAPVFVPGACWFDETGAGPHRCGTVRVPANRAKPGNPEIALRVIVLDALEPPQRPDPIVFLHGGPGSSAVRNPRHWFDHPLRKHRDFILFDQRGSWGSGNLCPAVNAALVAALARDYKVPQQAAAMAEAMTGCQAELQAAGIAMQDYKTSIIAADLDDIRRALGVARWNLFGVSYGTAVAQAAAHANPAPLRSILLDSASPNDPGWRSKTGENYLFALRRLFALCAAAADCADRYPQLPRTYADTIAMLETRPLVSNGFVMNRQDFELILHQLLYAPALMPFAPALVEAISRRDTQVAANLAGLFGDRALRSSFGAHFAIDCQGRGVAPGTRVTAQTFPLTAQYAAICPALGLTNADPDALPKHPATVPTLILSGRLDPITPPPTAVRIMRDFTNARMIELAGQGHGVTGSSRCAEQLMAGFFDDPARAIDQSCAKSAPPIAFATRFLEWPQAFATAQKLFVSPDFRLITGLGATLAALLLVAAWPHRTTGLARRIARVAAALALIGGLVLIGSLAMTGTGEGKALLVLGLPAYAVVGLWALRAGLVLAGASIVLALTRRREPVRPVLLSALPTLVMVGLFLSSGLH